MRRWLGSALERAETKQAIEALESEKPRPGPVLERARTSAKCKVLDRLRVQQGQREDCAVLVLYLILRFLEDLAASGGSDPA